MAAFAAATSPSATATVQPSGAADATDADAAAGIDAYEEDPYSEAEGSSAPQSDVDIADVGHSTAQRKPPPPRSWSEAGQQLATKLGMLANDGTAANGPNGTNGSNGTATNGGVPNGDVVSRGAAPRSMLVEASPVSTPPPRIMSAGAAAGAGSSATDGPPRAPPPPPRESGETVAAPGGAASVAGGQAGAAGEWAGPLWQVRHAGGFVAYDAPNQRLLEGGLQSGAEAVQISVDGVQYVVRFDRANFCIMQERADNPRKTRTVRRLTTREVAAARHRERGLHDGTAAAGVSADATGADGAAGE